MTHMVNRFFNCAHPLFCAFQKRLPPFLQILGKPGGEEGFCHFTAQNPGDDPAAHGEDIRVVDGAAFFGRIGAFAAGCVNALELIGDDRHAHAGAADQNGALELAVLNFLRRDRRHLKKRLRLLRIKRAAVGHFVAFAGEIRFDLFFQDKPGFIRSNQYLHLKFFLSVTSCAARTISFAVRPNFSFR